MPLHRASAWYYVGGLGLFLLLLTAGTGMLLSMYYQPNANPAVAADGTPLVAARVTHRTEWRGTVYPAGTILALPLNPATNQAMADGPLAGNVETMLDPVTNSPIRPAAAWVSVERTIQHDVAYGWLVRSVHAYSANLLIALLAVHMFSVFFMRAYRQRRRWMWVGGVGMFALVLAFAFTGYLLPWNRLSYAATQIGIGVAEHSAPWIGPALATLVRGGRELSAATLTRLYSLHATILPLAGFAFVGLHLLLLNIHGLKGTRRAGEQGTDDTGTGARGAAWLLPAMLGAIGVAGPVASAIINGGVDTASPLVLIPLSLLPIPATMLMVRLAAWLAAGLAQHAEARSIPFYHSAIYRHMLCWLLMFGTVLTLAIAAPWSHPGEMGLPVDLTKPIHTPPDAHPEWYFMFAFQALRILPATAAAAIGMVVGILWLGLPWLDRRKQAGRLVPALGIAAIAALIALTAWGYASIGR